MDRTCGEKADNMNWSPNAVKGDQPPRGNEIQKFAGRTRHRLAKCCDSWRVGRDLSPAVDL